MECVDKCDYLLFGSGKFYCNFYKEELTAGKSLSIENPDNLSVTRCEKCIKEELIGSNTTQETARKFKQELGWMGDALYQMKDDIEEGMTRMYKILRELEEREVEKYEDK